MTPCLFERSSRLFALYWHMRRGITFFTLYGTLMRPDAPKFSVIEILSLLRISTTAEGRQSYDAWPRFILAWSRLHIDLDDGRVNIFWSSRLSCAHVNRPLLSADL